MGDRRHFPWGLLGLALWSPSANAQASTGVESIEVVWRAGECPTRDQLALALGATGLSVATGGPRVTVSRTESGAFELELNTEDRSHRRTLQVQGSCDAQAAALAGVIERFVRPLATQNAPPRQAPPAGSASTGRTEGSRGEGSRAEASHVRRAPKAEVARRDAAGPASQISGGGSVFGPERPEVRGTPSIELEGTEVSASGARAAAERADNRLGVGGLLSFSQAARARPGIELRFSRLLTSRVDLTAGVAWAAPVRVEVGSGSVVANELRALLNVGLRPLAQLPVYVEAGAALQGMRAEGIDLAITKRVNALNPAFGLGLALRVPVGRLALELAARSYVFLDVLRLQVDDHDVLVFQRFEFTTTAAVYFSF